MLEMVTHFQQTIQSYVIYSTRVILTMRNLHGWIKKDFIQLFAMQSCDVYKNRKLLRIITSTIISLYFS